MKNLVFFVVGALLASAAFGQPDASVLSAALACRSIENDIERLTCLDTALDIDSSRGRPAETEVEADSEFRLIEVEPNATAAATEVEPLGDTSPVEASRSDDDANADAAVADRTITVVEIRESAFGVTIFVAEGGESWVQSGGSRGRFPPVPFETILQPGLGDSYFLLSPLGGPRARVMPR